MLCQASLDDTSQAEVHIMVYARKCHRQSPFPTTLEVGKVPGDSPRENELR